MLRTFCATLVVALAVGASAPAAGAANPVLSVSDNTLPANTASTITVTGRDYLVPPHAPGTNVFGGVYVFFGWVRPSGGWGPSIRNSNNNDGNYGVTYNYGGDGGDPGTRNDHGGTMRFVAFTEGGTSGDTTAYHMDDNGNWAASLLIPGATYSYTVPATGETHAVDCRVVQCGVFTIGAHGKASATNEKFTPITFQNPTPPTTQKPGGDSGGTGGGTGQTGGAPTGGTNGGSVPGGGVPGSKPGTTVNSKSSTTVGGGSTTTAAPKPMKAKPGAKSDSAEASDGSEVAVAPTAATSESEGAPIVAIVVGVLAVAAAAVGGWFFTKRRRGRPA